MHPHLQLISVNHRPRVQIPPPPPFLFPGHPHVNKFSRYGARTTWPSGSRGAGGAGTPSPLSHPACPPPLASLPPLPGPAWGPTAGGSTTSGGGGGTFLGGGTCFGAGIGVATAGAGNFITASGCGGISGGLGIVTPASTTRCTSLDRDADARFPPAPGQKAVTATLTNRTMVRRYWPRSCDGSSA